MKFTSLAFVVFLPLMFLFYWRINTTKGKNALLVLGSIIFYSWWDWRFTGLLGISILVDYFAALNIERSKSLITKKKFVLFSIAVNIGLLFVFKYFNFFANEFISSAAILGWQIEPITAQIILPMGISFYTFQSLSYTIDVYKKEISATNDIISFIAFITFFPQLVAGPIEKASSLLTQLEENRIFKYLEARDGLKQILWGVFLKLIIADRCAPIANNVFQNYSSLNSIDLLIGTLAFSLQIYGDFAGYSHIAIGTAKLFGIKLSDNFLTPYFSQSIIDFWRRWHITLMRWLKDYIYIPLGGSRKGSLIQIRNILFVFILSGIWHGANWTFIIWGIYNGILVSINNLLLSYTKLGVFEIKKFNLNISNLIYTILTFSFVSIGWIIFRSESINDAFEFFRQFFMSFSLTPSIDYSLTTVSLSLAFILIEGYNMNKSFPLENIETILKPFYRYTIYTLIVMIILFSKIESQEFIYFQF